MRVVVTGGGTIAPIDDVRHVANASTGRFSAAISEAWLERGADVWHVHAPSAERPIRRHLGRLDLDADPAEIRRRLDEVTLRWRAHRDRLHLVPLPRGDVRDYATALAQALRPRPTPADVVMLAMAASDFEPEPTPGKLSSDADELLIRCRRAPKVIQSVRDWAPDAYLVGFKLLSGATEAELIRAAEEACHVNRADLTVANDLRHYRAGRHTIHLVRPGHPVETYCSAEGDLAARLVDRILDWTDRSGSGI
ncbi:phosphopantothenoylcysteine decarboxylase domain-containing protein [Tautonia plasticadhaerens]|uniref:Phosphopantothenate--cysteine ligase n=1 Tax=Tautonia plasticadhaerens TaxID=2527974 RepID=A0A518HC34_9BACT|nr:phosphopantothenoylcysteine decarboxylase [Tautonia plasticadhaerens]QDV38410.1 phosphopantothenate--cysteine ligase [Tautonia plasticadhaerens]